MIKFCRRNAVVIFFDLLLALFAFGFSWNICGSLHMFWLVLFAVIWVLIGTITHKLYFSEYKRRRYVLASLFIVNTITGGVLFLLYHYFISDDRQGSFILIAAALLFALEFLLYYVLYLLLYRKRPYAREEPFINKNLEAINELSVEKSAVNEDVNKLVAAIKDGVVHPIEWIISQLESDSVVLESSNFEDVLQHKILHPTLIIHNHPLNMIRHLNTLLSETNYKLENKGYLVCRCVSAGIRRNTIMNQMPTRINRMIYFFDYLIYRVLPKLPVFKKIYYCFTRRENRVLPRVEVLGRLYRAGFDVLCENIIGGELYVVAQKIKPPLCDTKPSYGVFIRLLRKGKNGKIIGVYKFRTMYAYSEYLQPYMYKTEGLYKDGGRYGNDYRISTLGKFMRKVFIDELPMLINWIKGDVKLVGVRPLSSHYFHLYSKELQELRIKVKPGLLPPYYADRPKSLQEKQESEMRYLRAYLKNPIRTDWVYFWRIFESIVFRGARSK